MISKDITYYGIIKAINVIVWIIILKISAAYLDPVSFGDFSVIYSISIYLGIILTGWQSSSALRFYHEVDNKYEYYNVLLKTLFFPFLIFFGLGLIYCLLFYSYSKETPIEALLIVPLSIVYAIYGLVVSISRIKRNLKFYLILIIIQALALLCFAIPLMKLFGWVGLTFSFTISYLALIVYFIINKHNQLKLVWHKAVNKSLVKKMVSYGLPIVIIGVFSQLLSSMDQIFLKYFGYDYEVGIYAANYNLSEKSIFAFLAIYSSAFTPILYKSINKKNFNLLNQIKKGLFQFLIIAIPIVVFLSIFSKKISYLLLDQKYVEGHWIIPIIAIAGVLVGIASYYSEVLTVSKQTKTLAILYGFAALLNFIINIIFIPNYGLKAAVIATFISYFVLAIIIYIVSNKQYKMIYVKNRH